MRIPGLGQTTSACGTDPCGLTDILISPSSACCAFLNCNGGSSNWFGALPLDYAYACPGAAAAIASNMLPVVGVAVALVVGYFLFKGK